MKNQWDDQEARKVSNDPLATRVYSSRLLGREGALVLHGGGNTSVKAQATNILGDVEEILYVKGSGWDLATIEAAGFAPVRLDIARRMAGLEHLSDTDMVRLLRAAMIDPEAPDPSVEALLHAIIPFRYADHTHADAVVTITNTEGAEERLHKIYADEVLIIPYVMPGFQLAKTVHALTRNLDWSKLTGLVLMNHGLLTFSDEAKQSYENMIRLVSRAEDHLKQKGAAKAFGLRDGEKRNGRISQEALLALAQMRRAVSKVCGQAVLAMLDDTPDSVGFAGSSDASSTATRGPITPDHVIRTKRVPVIIGERIEEGIAQYAKDYRAYFDRHASKDLRCLDPAPRWALWPGHGSVTFGRTLAEANIASDIAGHTMRAIRWAENLGGWKPLPEQALFEVEYWTLEQAKLKRFECALPLQGKIAIVTGGASGIGQACVEALHSQGAVVAALDINPGITSRFTQTGVIGLVCDVTDQEQVQEAVRTTIRKFGGLDILISNAGMFPESETIAKIKSETWKRSMDVNLGSHQLLLQACIPYLSIGIDPAVVIVASKNVPAPGPGASAYSVAKAGLTQLARVAALELGPAGVRVNVVHPNQVFDTAIWTPEVLAQRAAQYGMSVADYRANNLLRVEITSRDVAELACAMAGPIFAKTTGAQVPVDGGNERVV